jgi:hypothetical protein
LFIPEVALIRKIRTKSLATLPVLLLVLNVLVALPPGNLGGQPFGVQQTLAAAQALVWFTTLLYFMLLGMPRKNLAFGKGKIVQT